MSQEQFAATVRDLLNDHLQNHSPIQMDYFITGMHGITDYGRYKQALREVDKRFRGLKSQLLEMQIQENELAKQYWIYEHRNENSEEGFEKEEARLKALQGESGREDAQRSVNDTARELTHFVAQAQHYLVKLSKGNKDWKLEDHFDKLQWEFWEAQILYRGSLDAVAGGTPSRATYELALSLPLERRQNMLRKLRDPGLTHYAEKLEGEELKLSVKALPDPAAVVEAIACL